MAYYNRNKETLKLNNMKYLNHGHCAKILYNKDIIFKKYYQETILDFRLSPEMFDILKDVNNPHFIELLDIYNKSNFAKMLKNKFIKSQFITDAYTAKYYPNNSINILEEQKDYILDNFRELENLFNIFSEHIGVCTEDIKKDNTVINKEGIIIVDPDLFFTMDTSTSLISILNKKNLLNLFKSICIESLVNEADYNKLLTCIHNDFNIKVEENTDITHEISKKLKYVKKPIDLFTK